MLLDLAKLTLNLTPDSLALRLVDSLASRTQRPPLDQVQRDAINQAQSLRYGTQASHTAWCWGEGPLVLMVHGWNGRAAQMAPLARHIAEQGYRAVALDITGHGDSPGARTQWQFFRSDLLQLLRALEQDIHTLIGHSAGALAMMAARHAGEVEASRYACICAPSHPFPPIEVIRRKLAPRPAVIQHYQALIAEQLGASWDDMQAGAFYRGLNAKTLLIYDQDDRIVSHQEGDKLSGFMPTAQLLKTQGYGHTRILTAPEVKAALTEFVGA